MSENIIRFPGSGDGSDEQATPEAPAGPVRWEDLSEDQIKAVQVVLSGMDFVCLGIKPTDSGADFFTAVHGEATVLGQAQPHLAGVIDRAFARKGI
ncbi:MAG: hypothetical protein ACOCYV_00175 [Planctomycetota bacterium]